MVEGAWLEVNRSYESLIVIHDNATLVLPERRPAFAELIPPACRPAANEFTTKSIEFIRAKMALLPRLEALPAANGIHRQTH